jgi:hypothetical protein
MKSDLVARSVEFFNFAFGRALPDGLMHEELKTPRLAQQLR